MRMLYVIDRLKLKQFISGRYRVAKIFFWANICHWRLSEFNVSTAGH